MSFPCQFPRVNERDIEKKGLRGREIYKNLTFPSKEKKSQEKKNCK